MFECEPTRRGFLLGSAAVAAWAALPKLASAAGARDPRLVTVILRGGLDGLAAVAPIGDRAYEAARGGLALSEAGEASIPLDNFFALNPRMPHIAGLYRRGEALFVHATSTPYRGRSHFDGQDILENGLAQSGYHRDGWLGRALAVMPAADRVGRFAGFAVAPTTPLVLKGERDILTFMPVGFHQASIDTRARLLDLYEHTDPTLADILESGVGLEEIVGTEAELTEATRMGTVSERGRNRSLEGVATAAGRAMATDDGPRVGFLDINGFDTHRAQRPVEGLLGRQLALLDAGIAALERALGPVWKDTTVVVITEFGRTVAMNGSSGTDHGTATVAMLFGGAVRGGRVVADWPGLGGRDLYEGRDLKPTTDLRAVLKGVLRDQFGLDDAVLATTVFPDSADVRPMDSLTT
jgi:uncharacterized protein (DUF1501 family)